MAVWWELRGCGEGDSEAKSERRIVDGSSWSYDAAGAFDRQHEENVLKCSKAMRITIFGIDGTGAAGDKIGVVFAICI